MSRVKNCVPRCMKYSVYFMNLLFWALGIFSMGVGLHVHYEQMKPMQDALQNISNPAVLIIALGFVLFISSTIGCIGSRKENLEFLRGYLLALLFLLMINVAMGIASFIIFNSAKPVRDGAEKQLRVGLVNYREDLKLARYLDGVQRIMHCCGLGEDGYKDWSLNSYYQCVGTNASPVRCSVPQTCCKMGYNESLCGFGLTNDTVSKTDASSIIYTKGCLVQIEETLQSAALTLGVLSFGVTIPILCGILVAARLILFLQERDGTGGKKHHQNVALSLADQNFLYHITEPRSVNAFRPSYENSF